MTPTVQSIQSDEKFKALSPDAQGIVFDRVAATDAGFKALSPDAQAEVRSRVVSSSPAPTQKPPEKGFVDRALTMAAGPLRFASRVANAATDPLIDVARVAQGEPIGQVWRLPARSLPGVNDRSNPLVTEPLRLAPSLIPMPLVAGAASGAAEALAEKTEQPDQPVSPARVAIAAVTPPAASGAVRLGRALGRTATRVVPSLFRAAHEQALGEAAQVGSELGSEVAPGQLFDAARQATPAPIPPRRPIAALPPAGGSTVIGPARRFETPIVPGDERLPTTYQQAPISMGPATQAPETGLWNRMRIVEPQRASATATATAATPATQGAGETIPATNITRTLSALDREIPATPVSPALKTVRDHMKNLSDAVQGGNVSLSDLMGLRRDIGLSIGRGQTGEVQALYKGVMQDLEAAAAGGSPAAAMAKAALDAYKKDLGARKFADFVQQATRSESVGAGTPSLNVAKLRNLVDKNRDELTKLLGLDGVGPIDDFIAKYRTLPPTHAANFANRLIAGMAGGLGIAGLGLPGAGAAIAPELLTNTFAVGPNPRIVNRLVQLPARAATTLAGPGQGLTKATRDAHVNALYPGRQWGDLTPQERQAVADRINGAQ